MTDLRSLLGLALEARARPPRRAVPSRRSSEIHVHLHLQAHRHIQEGDRTEPVYSRTAGVFDEGPSSERGSTTWRRDEKVEQHAKANDQQDDADIEFAIFRPLEEPLEPRLL